MEDVWKDITTLSSFHSPLTPNPKTHHGPILRDFFTAAGEPDSSSPAPATPLNFNRCGGFPCYGSSSVNAPFQSMASSSTAYLMDSFLKKRCSEEKTDCSGDRKYKRMMKNRESAVRSRARRNAYRFELEKEKTQLIEENARLWRVLQGHTLFSAAAASTNEEKEAPKQRNRLRSLSALF